MPEMIKTEIESFVLVNQKGIFEKILSMADIC